MPQQQPNGLRQTDRRSEIPCNASCSRRPGFRNTLQYFVGTLHDLAVVSNTLIVGQVSAIDINTFRQEYFAINCNYAVVFPNFSCL